jgi:hypothetical protein
MADEQHEVRRVNWQEVLSFPQIFRCFRMAIHPSKMLLAMAAIVLVFVGGWVFDQFWGLGGGYARPNEIWDHYSQPAMRFEQEKEQWDEGRLESAARLLADCELQRRRLLGYLTSLPSGRLKEAFRDELAEQDLGDWAPRSYRDVLQEAESEDMSWSDLLAEAEDEFAAEAEAIRDVLSESREAAEKKLDGATFEDDEDEEEAYDQLSEHVDQAHRALSIRRLEFRNNVRRIRGDGIFASFLDWELDCVSKAVAAVRYANVTGGLAQYREVQDSRDVPAMTLGPSQAVQSTPVPANGQGFLFYVLMMWEGVVWLYSEHWVYAAMLSLMTLAVVALLGGAVNRIAALHFARDERISITQALRFAFGKFFSFFTAPLIPLGTIVMLGLLLSVGGLLFNIPAVGEIVGGLLFALAIIGGLIITFLLIGLLAGAPLMYPTIAVEGSDSFDAISRSFSYIFNQAWRGIFYGLVALVYGVITYLFVRLFAYLALLVTHSFVKLGVFVDAPSLHPQADKLELLWSRPTFDSLFGSFNWSAMSGAQQIGAFLIGVWVFLVAVAVAAYLLTFAASSTTVIYFLLRRKVDATDLDDVYVEEPEELPTPPAEAPDVAESGQSAQDVAAEQPSGPAEGEQEPPAPAGGGQEPEQTENEEKPSGGEPSEDDRPGEGDQPQG